MGHIDSVEAPSDVALRRRIRTEQVRTHYENLPGMITAPLVGGMFSVWVLWNAVNQVAMLAGFCLLALLSVARLFLYRHYRRRFGATGDDRWWRIAAVAASGTAGVIWGGVGAFLYPATDPGYDVFLVILCTVVPVIPVTALASYMPAFIAFYVPCFTPFVVHLLLVDQSRPSVMSAMLLLMLMGATLSFATAYYRNMYARIRLQTVVERQRGELAQANEAKSQFLAAASHDLRQPLHASSLLIDALDPHLTHPRAKLLRSDLQASTNSFGELLGNLLDHSRLDIGAVQVEKRPFLVDEVLSRVTGELAPQARAKGLRLRCVASSAWVESDPDAVARILRNLIGNAIRYTDTGGVLVGCRRRGDDCCIQVVDSGVGIDRREHARIFDDYAQLADTAPDRRQGLGLGLAIVRRTAALIGAPIAVHSRPASGSVFSLTLPGARPEALETVPVGATDHDDRLCGRLVLAIDDDPGIRRALAALGEAWSCRIVTVADVAQATGLLATWRDRIDAVLLDYRLADNADGLANIALLRAGLDGRCVPIVVITGDVRVAQEGPAQLEGCAVLHKPIRSGRLRVLLQQLIEPQVPRA